MARQKYTYADGRTFNCLKCGKTSLMRYDSKNMYCSPACSPQCQKGKKMSAEAKAKRAKSMAGRPLPEGFLAKKGEHRNPAFEFKKGHVSPVKGKKYTREQIDAMVAARMPYLLRGEDHPNYKGGKARCKTCNKVTSRYDAQYCRAHCGALKSGSLSGAWKGGVTPESKLERRKFQQAVQPLVFKRDSYTCQMCNQVGGYLQVDHIKSWADYPDLRFDLDNCRTLCMACHYFVTFDREMPEGLVWGHNLSRRVAS